MANDKITMLKLKRMLQLLDAGKSMNDICRDLHMSKRTVHNYKQRVTSSSVPLTELRRLDDKQLNDLLQPQSPVPKPDERKEALDKELSKYLKEWNKPYVSVLLLWEEYRKVYPNGYQSILLRMTNLRLTEHFTLAEFERSATAIANGIDNRVPNQYVPTLQRLCKECLDPLRAFANSPEGRPSHSLSPSHEVPIISSGYRCNQLNIKVGGAYASQHPLGEAANIYIPKTPYTDWDNNLAHTDMDIASKWFDWLESHCDFDQLILETSNGRDYWIHVSCRKNKKANRHQVYRNMKK